MFAASLNTLKKRVSEAVKGEDLGGRSRNQTADEELGPPSLEARESLRSFAPPGRGGQGLLEEGPVLVRYEVQNGDDADREGAAFPLPTPAAGGRLAPSITVGHVRAHFPMPGRYHFRFKAALPDGVGGDFVMVDLADTDTVPMYRSEICLKALRLPAEADPFKVLDPIPGGGRLLAAAAASGIGKASQNSPRRSASPTSPFASPPASSYDSPNPSRSPPPQPRGSTGNAAGMTLNGLPGMPTAAASQAQQLTGGFGVPAAAAAPASKPPAGPAADLMDMGDLGDALAAGGQPTRPSTGNAIATAAMAAASAPPVPKQVFDREKLVAEREAYERKRVEDATARQQEASRAEEELKQSKVKKNQELGVEMDRWAKTPDGQNFKDIKVLLSTMHTVTWPNAGWKELPLAELVSSDSNVKKWYRKAILIVHPDKQTEAAPDQQVRADRIFQALNEAFKVQS